MKILHLIYTHGIAGAEKYLRHLLPPLKEHGIESHLVLVCPRGCENKLNGYCEEMSAKGIPASVLVYSKAGFLTAAKKINKYAKQHNIGHIHSHLINSDIIAILVKLFYNKKITLISTKHGYNENTLKQVRSPDDLGAIRFKAMFTPYYYFAWLTLKLIPYNFAVSGAMARIYYKLGFTKTQMPHIHHGVSVAPGCLENAPAKKGNPQLLIIGRLQAIKGHMYLIEAMPEILRHYPDTILLVLGEGSERGNFEKAVHKKGIGKSVLFMGFQANPYSYIHTSDVVVIPSLFEPFGLVFIEALALQKPVVAFDVAAGNEILTDGETALLVPKANAVMLAEKITALLDNPELLNKISRNGFEHYQNNFTTEVMVEKTRQYYLQLKK